MFSAAQLRQQIEAALADRIPSALTPPQRVFRPSVPTGIASMDAALGGGLPLGAITEVSGPECSGRTSFALYLISELTRQSQVCAWVDGSDALHPESAAASGIDLTRLLWIRCGSEPEQLPLPGFGQPADLSPEPGARTPQPHARSLAPHCAEPQPTIRRKNREALPPVSPLNSKFQTRNSAVRNSQPVPGCPRRKPWSRLDQALRATDLLLNAGGFAAIVLDLGSIAPEFALRIPLATWFRFRSAAERTQASVLLITQQLCTKSSAGLVLHCQPGPVTSDTTVLTSFEHQIEIARERFAPTAPVTEFTRKPPQSDRSPLHSGNTLRWQTQTPWAPPQPPKAGHP